MRFQITEKLFYEKDIITDNTNSNGSRGFTVYLGKLVISKMICSAKRVLGTALLDIDTVIFWEILHPLLPFSRRICCLSKSESMSSKIIDNSIAYSFEKNFNQHPVRFAWNTTPVIRLTSPLILQSGY